MIWPFKKLARRHLLQTFEIGVRLIQVSLFSRLSRHYETAMAEESAKTLAAQVVNHLKGDDVESVMHASAEPNKAAIAQVKDQVAVYAGRAMADSRATREAIVATLRMRAFIEFMLQGKAYFSGELHKRIEGLLRTYGAEFPEEITPGRFLAMRNATRKKNSLRGVHREINHSR